MKYLLKLFPEIAVKSQPVRKEMARYLRTNVRNTLARIDSGVRVIGRWDALEVMLSEGNSPQTVAELEVAMTRIPGIHSILTIEDGHFDSFAHTAERVIPLWASTIAGKRFRVRVKRHGKHEFGSPDIERYLGAELLKAVPDAQVDLKRPEVVVPLEIKHNRLILVTQRRTGLGGYPLGTQGATMALISGGFDSPVAAYRMIRRGIKTHFLFFNLGGPAHEEGVREVTYHLWQRYAASHKASFISVPFEGVVKEILTQVPDRYMGVVLKRMMVRAASRLAERSNIPALVTGDAIAQVSSQSLTNLALIDSVADRPVLRPLLTSDKQDIIDEAREIGTAEFAERMPEYCGVISKRPSTHARQDQIEGAESGFDFEVLEQAIEQSTRTRVAELARSRSVLADIQVVSTPDELVSQTDFSVIDIRHPSERDAMPLEVPKEVERLEIPFYSLQDEARSLPTDKRYLLYCGQGVMSRMQAQYLADQGLTHFGVYTVNG